MRKTEPSETTPSKSVDTDFLVVIITILGPQFWTHDNRDPLLQQWYKGVRMHLDQMGVPMPFRDPVPETAMHRGPQTA